MKVLTEHLKFHTKTHRAYVHMTPQVDEIVRKSGVKEGMVLVSAMHITAGVYVNDNESGLIEDIDQWLEHLAPFRKNYKHHETGEDNGDSHLKALLIHHEVIVPITAGRLDLGTWQRIFYAEFDGQRDKRVIVKVMGEGLYAGRTERIAGTCRTCQARSHPGAHIGDHGVACRIGGDCDPARTSRPHRRGCASGEVVRSGGFLPGKEHSPAHGRTLR